jgi:uncharacterized membrane protein
MATVASDFEGRDVSIGRIFNRAFGTIGSNPVATLGIAFVFGALPGTLIGYGSQYLQRSAFMILGLWTTVAIGLVSLVLSVACAMLTHGALVRATIAHSEGRKAGFAESAQAGLAVVVPLLLLSIGSGLAIGVGMILLLVPGIILYVMWSVAAPALVEENLGIFQAFERSNELTSGARWKIFGLELVAFVAYWMFSAAVGALAFALFGGLHGIAAVAASGFPISYYILTAVSKTITAAIWGVIQTSLYVELRNWHEGPPTHALAEVFG